MESVIMGGFATTCPRCGQEYTRGGRIGGYSYAAPEDCACPIVEDAVTRLGGYPDSVLEGPDGLAQAVSDDRARLERGIITERDRLKARYRELMRLADKAFRRRSGSYEGSQLIAMADELGPSIAALTALAGDGGGL
jgi:hypothetical protein